MTFKYAGTIPEEGEMTIPRAYELVGSFPRNEVNLHSYKITSITIDDSDIEYEFTSPSRVCVDDYPIIVEVK